MSRKIILIKQELLLLVYELNRSGLLAENEKIRPILAQLEKLLLCDLSPSDRKSGSAGMPRPISYAVFCLKKKNRSYQVFAIDVCVGSPLDNAAKPVTARHLLPHFSRLF